MKVEIEMYRVFTQCQISRYVKINNAYNSLVLVPERQTLLTPKPDKELVSKPVPSDLYY